MEMSITYKVKICSLGFMVKDFFNCDEHEEDDGPCYFQLLHELGQGPWTPLLGRFAINTSVEDIPLMEIGKE